MEQKTKLQNWLGSGSVNLFGRPFAGKDTQGVVLAEFFGATMISSGDVLRKAKDNVRLQEILASGDIIPSDLFMDIVLPYLRQDELAGRPLVLSEVGRLLDEAKAVIEASEQSGHPLRAVVALELSEQEVWNRFIASQIAGDRGSRADDRKEVLQTRLDRYRERVLPVLEFYRGMGMLIEVDGTLSKEQVTEEIFAQLAAKA